MAHKRTTIVAGGNSLLEKLPESIINEIFVKIEPENLTATLCCVACVSPTLHSSVNKTFSSISSLDLSAFSLDSETFDGVVKKYGMIKKITLDCLRVNESSITSLLGADIEELVLLKCCSLSYEFLASIGITCPNLRVLTLELSEFVHKTSFVLSLEQLLTGCRCLEALKLLPLNSSVFTDIGVPVGPTTFGQTLTCISLVLDVITDLLVHAIAVCLPLLTDLDLKDLPYSVQFNDLSDVGLQSLVGCRYLTSLSLERRHSPTSFRRKATSFRRVTDMGMFLLSEGCKGLQSVRLGGFSEVTDSGFTSFLNSCLNLEKFQIQNALLLTDMTFRDISKGCKSLVEVKLVSCSSITSEAVHELATCSSLEVLDLFGCKSIADSCLTDISRLTLLTYLNLGHAGVTDDGMTVLGKLSAPVSCLSLRGCMKVTDKGITLLLGSKGKINEILSSLDVSHIPGITDNAITTIVDTCLGLTELRLRNCFLVTDASVKSLAMKGRLQGESKLLRKLDLYNCTVSADSFKYLKKPMFRGLQWIGIGETDWISVEDARFSEICRERRWLNICRDGCEVACHDRWEYHKQRP